MSERRSPPTPAGALLLSVALAPPTEASAAWAEVARAVELSDLAGADLDALCLAALRLAALGVGRTERALAVGVARHAWTASRLVLSDLAARADHLPPGQVPVLGGRLATVVGYLPNDRVLPVRVLELARRPGPTVDSTVLGRPVRVPSPAAHLVDCLLERRWVDAAWIALAIEPPWPAVAAEAGRRRQRGAVLRGLGTLSAIVSRDLVEPARAAGAGPSRAASLRERGWAAVFATTRPVRSRARRRALEPARSGTPSAARPF